MKRIESTCPSHHDGMGWQWVWSGALCVGRLSSSRTRGSQCVIHRSQRARLVLFSFNDSQVLHSRALCIQSEHVFINFSSLFTLRLLICRSSLCIKKKVSNHLRLMSKSVKRVTEFVRRLLNGSLRSLRRRKRKTAKICRQDDRSRFCSQYIKISETYSKEIDVHELFNVQLMTDNLMRFDQKM